MAEADFNVNHVWGSAFNAGLGYLIFGYNIGVFTSTQPCVASTLGWGSSASLLIPIMTSLLFVGGLLGALFTGNLKKFGRRKGIMLADWIIIFGSIIIVVPFTIAFAIGRFIIGFACGMFVGLCPMYINEKTPSKMSGKVGALLQVYACLGVLIAYGSALMLPTGGYNNNPLTYLWIAIFSFQGLLALLQFLIFKIKYRLDTPTSLIDRGLESKALRSLLQVYPKEGAASIIDSFSASIISTTSVSPTPSKAQSYYSLLLCKNGSSKMMRLGIMSCLIQECCGIVAILSYATTLFDSFGGGVFMSRTLTFISGIVKLVSVCIALPYVDTWGRKPMYVYGTLFMGMFLAMIAVFTDFVKVFYIIPFLCIEGFLIAYEMSVGPICWIYCGEIMNPKGMSIAMSANWLAMMLTSFTFPFIIEACGLGVTFFMYSGINFCAMAYSYFDFFETKGLDKSQIQTALSKYS